MATQSPNLGLTLPELGDNIADTIPALAANFLTLDEQIGEISANEHGYAVRFANGLQVCWHEVRVSHAGNARNLAGNWTFPQPFAGAPVVPAPALPTSSAKYSAGLALASLGHPFTVAGPTSTSASVYVWENSSPFTSGQWVDLMVFAIGRWK